MAGSMSEARALIDLARETGRLHAIVRNRRFIPGVRRMRRMVSEGTLGSITAVHTDFFIGAHFGGFREEDGARPAARHGHPHLRRHALRDRSQPARGVLCRSQPARVVVPHGASATAIFEFEGGAIGTYRGSWGAEGANTSWESSWRVIGTGGTLLWDGADGFDARLVSGDPAFLREKTPVAVPEPANPAETEGHASVIRAFVTSIETGGVRGGAVCLD